MLNSDIEQQEQLLQHGESRHFEGVSNYINVAIRDYRFHNQTFQIGKRMYAEVSTELLESEPMNASSSTVESGKEFQRTPRCLRYEETT